MNQLHFNYSVPGFRVLSVVILMCFSSILGASEQTKFPSKVNAFLKNYCISCHGPEKQKGNLRIDTLDQDLVKGEDGENWHEVFDSLTLDEMPPKKATKHPGKAERVEIIKFFESAFIEASKKRRETGGKVVMRRLTNYEYNNTVNDLLLTNENWSKDFPPDSTSNEGFKNNGFYMGMSSFQIENYVEAAKMALDEVIVENYHVKPELKTIDVKDVNELVARDGKKVSIGGPNKRILYWKDYPPEGPVLVDIVLSGVKENDIKKIRNESSVDVGSMINIRGNAHRFAINPLTVEPLISKRNGLFHLQYLIPRIEDFPNVDESYVYPYRVIKFHYGGRKGKDKFEEGVKVEKMTAQGPYYKVWPPEPHRNVFISSKNEKNEEVYAREILSSFMARAWRRQVTKEEVDEIYSVYQSVRKTKSFVKTIKDCLIQIMVSPDFLYLVERKGSSAKVEKLTPHELSNRLSYFLWSSKPDLSLNQLASTGKIASPETLRSEVRRMLQDKKSWRFVEQFTTQWLELDRMDTVAVSPEIYPQFVEEVKEDMRDETKHFFNYVLQNNMSALNFIDSDFSFMTERLNSFYKGGKKFYGGSEIKKVTLNKKDNRGGILTHGSIHLALSDGEDSHVIKRAAWFVDRILGTPPSPPPADVELNTQIEGFDKMSKKQQLAVHVEKESCARCHMKFDPYGVAFENFDATGIFRTQVRKVDQVELDKRLKNATNKDPKAEFKKIDTSKDGYIQENEWYTHLKATLKNSKALKPEAMQKDFNKVANNKTDKKQKTHPPKTITLQEYIDFRAMAEEEELAAIQSKLPYRYVKADASTVLPDSTKIANIGELKEYLLKNKKDEFAENVVRRLLTYALGRSLEFSDDQIVKNLTGKFKNNNYKLASLIEEITLCSLFYTK